ncbi:hypothetical protein ACFZDG_03915 [Kitasatospora xanthocidica]|uniref:hypothetical protein n=1 Tax=Kitasatospora xanthocidica TaxID=83382 RepID=UPI0036ECB02E
MLGWLLVLSLLATVPVLIHLGGQTVEEGDDHSTNVFGLLFALAAVGVVLGPSLLATAGVHNGVRKLRLLRDDGSKTVWVRGRRLF